MSHGGRQQLLGEAEVCVDEALQGIAAAHPGLCLFPAQRLVVERGWLRAPDEPRRRRRVAMVCGGGSGHEPFVAGYVGEGMLAAAVAGHVFTSPPPAAVATAITTVGKDNPEGVLVVVFNYTGDRINFGLATERCRAAGVKVEMYVAGDDSALTQVEGTAGRRGLCGNIFIFKIVGAMVAAGASLEEAVEACRRVGGALGTIGAAASGCTLPGARRPLFTVAPDTLELGLGVHGETGAATIKFGTPREVVTALLNQLTRQDSATRLDLRRGDRVALMVNNLGCLSQLELATLTREAVTQLEERGATVERVYSGALMTSLDMRGFHLSVLRLIDPTWLALLDAPTTAPAWPAPCFPASDVLPGAVTTHLDLPSPAATLAEGGGYMLSEAEGRVMMGRLQRLVAAMPAHEERLNTLDAECGDGDCGSTLTKGMTAASGLLANLEVRRPAAVLAALAEVAASSMGGTSGGLYSILLTAAATHMAAHHQVPSPRRVWAAALRAGVNAVIKYGGASVGDRTMLDALVPALDALEARSDDQKVEALLGAMAEAADRGSRATATMIPRAGRASYVRLEKVSGEDAGARGVALLLAALL